MIELKRELWEWVESNLEGRTDPIKYDEKERDYNIKKMEYWHKVMKLAGWNKN